MQIIQSKNQFFEKVIRDKDGKLVRAKFCIYENDGRVKARLVDFVYIEEKAISGKVFALPGFIKNESSSQPTFSSKIKSPYFSFETLYFSGSKPRAPTFALVS